MSIMTVSLYVVVIISHSKAHQEETFGPVVGIQKVNKPLLYNNHSPLTVDSRYPLMMRHYS